MSTRQTAQPSSPGDRVEPGPRGRSPYPPAWRDPLMWACALVALAVYLPHGFDGILTRDLALYSYAGQQFAEGVPPYLGVVNRAGPLAHAVPGLGVLGARAIGMDDLLGMRVLFLLMSVAAIALSYVLARDVFRSRAAGLASAGTLLCIEGFINYATWGPREKTTLVLLYLVAVLAMAHRKWLLTGFFLALATLTWQPVFLPGIAGAAVAVLVGVPAGSRLRALLRIAVGGLVPTVLVVASYVAIGELQVFLDDFLVINARYTEQVSLMEDPDAVRTFMVEGYGPSGIVFLVGLAALLGLAVHGLLRPRARDEESWPMLVASFAVLAVGVLFALWAFNGFPDAFFLLPWAQLGTGGLCALVVARAARVGKVLTAAFVAVTLVMAVTYSLVHGDEILDGQREDVTAVMAVLPDDAKILAIEAPQPLVLTQQRNATRFQLFGNGLIDYLDDTWPGGRDGYAEHVLATEPEVIALGDLDEPEWMTGPMGSDYEPVGTSVGWTWYLSTDLGDEVLADARGALQ
jgi:hypothetical protein